MCERRDDEDEERGEVETHNQASFSPSSRWLMHILLLLLACWCFVSHTHILIRINNRNCRCRCLHHCDVSLFFLAQVNWCRSVFLNRTNLTLTHDSLHRLYDVVLPKSKGGHVHYVWFSHTQLASSSLSTPLRAMSPNGMSCVESCVCVSLVIIWREKGWQCFSVCVSVCFFFSHLRSLLSILVLSSLSSFLSVCLVSFFNWVAINSLTCRHSSKKGGEEEQKESIMSQKCSPPMFAVSVCVFLKN